MVWNEHLENFCPPTTLSGFTRNRASEVSLGVVYYWKIMSVRTLKFKIVIAYYNQQQISIYPSPKRIQVFQARDTAWKAVDWAWIKKTTMSFLLEHQEQHQKKNYTEKNKVSYLPYFHSHRTRLTYRPYLPTLKN